MLHTSFHVYVIAAVESVVLPTLLSPSVPPPPSVCPEAVVNDMTGENKAGAADVSASQHVMVCALKELGSLVQSLSATASPLIQEPSIGEGGSKSKLFTHFILDLG